MSGYGTSAVGAKTEHSSEHKPAKLQPQPKLKPRAGIFSPAHALTQEELVAKLEAAGYSQVRDIKSTPEGIAAKAKKDGKDVSLVVDSSGQVKERK